MTDDQIKHMVDRFLQWRLPENFSPDAGISFKREFNEHTAHPMKHEPVGTNLFNATQAEEMVRYMIDGMPSASLSLSDSELSQSAAPEGNSLFNWYTRQERGFIFSKRRQIVKSMEAVMLEKERELTVADPAAAPEEKK
jgi:hypothetical protein